MADDWNSKIIEEFRANKGKVGGNFDGFPMVLLTTTGAKSGQERINPLAALPDASDPKRVYVFASKAGAPSNPDWYYNLVAHPEVTVEFGTEKYAATAEQIEDRSERDAIYAKQVAVMPGFAEYEKNTTRVIPVIALVRK